MRSKICPPIVLTLLITVALPLSAQFWTKKPYTEWKANEVQKLLRDSPWAQHKIFGQIQIRSLTEAPVSAGPPSNDPLAGPPAGPTQPPIPVGRESNPQVTYTAQLWSAAPIRQAYVRQAQLAAGYDNLPPEKKKEFDEKYAQILNAEYSDVVIVRVFYNTNVQDYDRELAAYWQNQGPAQKNQIFLSGGRGQVNPDQVIVPAGAAREIQLVFPRMVNNEPILSSKDKKLSLEFYSPQIGALPAERVFMEFDVKKMMVDGKLVY